MISNEKEYLKVLETKLTNKYDNQYEFSIVGEYYDDVVVDLYVIGISSDSQILHVDEVSDVLGKDWICFPNNDKINILGNKDLYFFIHINLLKANIRNHYLNELI